MYGRGSGNEGTTYGILIAIVLFVVFYLIRAYNAYCRKKKSNNSSDIN